MRSVADEWASFRELVIPADASELQVLEMKRAFYSGGLAVFNLHLERANLSDGPADADATPEELAAVVALHEELVAYGRAQIEIERERS
jgi:hypothetical protein